MYQFSPCQMQETRAGHSQDTGMSWDGVISCKRTLNKQSGLHQYHLSEDHGTQQSLGLGEAADEFKTLVGIGGFQRGSVCFTTGFWNSCCHALFQSAVQTRLKVWAKLKAMAGRASGSLRTLWIGSQFCWIFPKIHLLVVVQAYHALAY